MVSLRQNVGKLILHDAGCQNEIKVQGGLLYQKFQTTFGVGPDRPVQEGAVLTKS